MTRTHWIYVSISLFIGATLGLIYGWWIAPVEYTDVTPGILREDYQVDYVLMVAEAFQSEQNVEVAARRLAVIASEAPSIPVEKAFEYAQTNGFSAHEIKILQDLLIVMQTYEPQGTISQ